MFEEYYLYAVLIIVILIAMVLLIPLYIKKPIKHISAKTRRTLQNKLGAQYWERGFYGERHKIIPGVSFQYVYTRHRSSFYPCKDCFIFDKNGDRWEIFLSSLYDEPSVNSENMLIIRVFCGDGHIRSEALVENILSQISVIGNNNYLIRYLHKPELMESLKHIVHLDSETLLINKNIIQYRFTGVPNSISAKYIISKIKYIYEIRKKVLRKHVLEY